MSETATTTPNDMPGTITEVKTGSATTEKDSSSGAATTTAKSGLDDADRAELERLRGVHKDEQKWRREATGNHRDAEAYRNLAPALLKALGIEDGNAPKDFDAKSAIADLTSKFETAERERIRSEVARTEGVNPRYVVGATEEEMRASAQEFKADLDAEVAKRTTKTTAAAPAGEVTSNGKVTGPQQINSRDALRKMSPEEQIKAHKEGRLDDLLGGKTT